MEVPRDVYPPSEDTALLLDALAKEPGSFTRTLDIGTGSGAVAFSLASRAQRVVATDVNPIALAHARAEAHRRGLANVAFLRADLLEPLRGSFDLVTFNAPYLPTAEDEHVEGPLDAALHGGEGGVEVARRFVRDLPRVLAPRGRALLVLSDRGDVAAVRREAAGTGLSFEEVARAAFFFERVLVFRICADPLRADALRVSARGRSPPRLPLD